MMMIISVIKHALKRRLYRYSFFYPKKNNDALRWGIIGLGNMAEVFATALDNDNDSRICAVASRSIAKAESFAERHGRCIAYGNYEEMLNDRALQLDVVYIATPAKYHSDHIRKCLMAGKNVLCEKPISCNADELEELIALANQNNCFLMEGMWMKCLPTFRKASEWLEKGLIGNLELVKVDFYKREIINPLLSIFNKDENGGIMYDFGIYAIAFISSFIGSEPDIINSYCRKSKFEIDADWQICVKKDSVKAFISLSSNFEGQSKAALIGTKGVIEWDSQFNRSNRIVRYDEYGKPVEEYIVNYQSEGLEYEIEEVRQSINNHRKQSRLVPLEDSLSTIRLIEKLVNDNEYHGHKR